jgi:hypothetical protein
MKREAALMLENADSNQQSALNEQIIPGQNGESPVDECPGG